MSKTRTQGANHASEDERLNAYYARTAEQYDQLHELDHPHVIALQVIAALLQRLNVRSVLDVGCGTGRVIRTLGTDFPKVRFHGVDPSAELLHLATERHGIPEDWLTCADGRDLPFADDEFDAVIATAVLHHVENPEQVIAEMLRVARAGVFISDTNTYAQGPTIFRVVKTLARTLGMIRQLQWIRHGGKRWRSSEGDGIAYPYSVFDSLDQLEANCTSVFVLPTSGRHGMLAAPMRFATHAVVCGIKEELA